MIFTAAEGPSGPCTHMDKVRSHRVPVGQQWRWSEQQTACNTKRGEEEHITPNIFQMAASPFKGTHVGHRTAAVGAVCHLTAGRLGGTLGPIWTGNCEDNSNTISLWCLLLLRMRFLVFFWSSLCFLRAPFSMLASG